MSETFGLARTYDNRRRSASMLTRIRPFSHRYQVATVTGAPSGRTGATVPAITPKHQLVSSESVRSAKPGLPAGRRRRQAGLLAFGRKAAG